MKFFTNFFDKIIYKPIFNYSNNLFFLKNNFYTIYKNILFIHFFINLKKKFKIKFIKFTYFFYKNFITYFILINIIIQFLLIFVIL